MSGTVAAARAGFTDDRRTGCDRRVLSPRALILLGVLALLGIASLTALGAWQLERRAWKLDLISRVERHLHASPAVAPGPAVWPGIGKAEEYRRVRLAGHFLHDRETAVQAVTALGGGSWLLTPLRTDMGITVLVNRGFVPAGSREFADRPPGEVTVTGLLRLAEPGGAFLRRNDPQAGRWFSRDVAAIGAAHGLSDVAPYFIDADAAGGPARLPVGGLTVVRFNNNHLVYAITWFGLDLMLAGAVAMVARREWRLRRGIAA